MIRIHPTAIVDPAATLGAGVSVGPYTIIGPDVHIGARTTVAHHSAIEGHTSIGEDNVIYGFASIGVHPQDKKYRGEPTSLVIGHRNTIREHCTISVGTVQDQGVTTIGHDNWIMANTHIAHDCWIGHKVVLVQNACLGGHVRVDDRAIIGGLVHVHQFCRVGTLAMVGMGVGVTMDVPPYMMVAGDKAYVAGLNLEGLQRLQFSQDTVCCLRQAYKVLYRQHRTLQQACLFLESMQHVAEIKLLLDFLQHKGRGIMRGKRCQ